MSTTTCTVPIQQHVTIQHVAGLLDVHPRKVRAMIADGTLPAVRVGARRPGTIRDTRRIRIPLDAVTAVVEPVSALSA